MARDQPHAHWTPAGSPIDSTRDEPQPLDPSGVDARRDLLQGIVAAQNKGMTSDQIFEYVSSVANSSVTPDPSDRAASYNYFRKIYAQELINVRARQGDEKALAFASSPLRKQWVNLRKQ